MKLSIRKSLKIEDIIRGCKKKKTSAQRELFDRFSPRMLGVCRRYVSSIPDAEDIMVNGFMKVFDKINQYRGEGSFEGWMIRIMVNESLTYIRRNRNMSVEVSLDKAGGEVDYDTAKDILMEEEVLRMIDELPVGYRTVFNLYVMEGYSHKEISEMLNISTGASKSQLSRAKSLLRSQIAQFQQETKKKSHEE